MNFEDGNCPNTEYNHVSLSVNEMFQYFELHLMDF